MEPLREKPKAAKPGSEQKRKRFRIVKLEERIALKKHVSSVGEGHSGLVSIE